MSMINHSIPLYTALTLCLSHLGLSINSTKPLRKAQLPHPDLPSSTITNSPTTLPNYTMDATQQFSPPTPSSWSALKLSQASTLKSALEQQHASSLKSTLKRPLGNTFRSALKWPVTTLRPVRLAPKHCKSGSKKRKNNYVSPLFHDRGYPNPQDDWESTLPEVKAGRLIRKRLHHVPPLTDIGPNFGVDYDEFLHGIMLCEHLDISHLIPARQLELTNLIQQYWKTRASDDFDTLLARFISP